MVDRATIQDRYLALSGHLDERARRSFAAGEARAAGYGGIAAVSQATGIAPSTISRGLKELAGGSDVPLHRVRRPDGGRKSLLATDSTLLPVHVTPADVGDRTAVKRLAADIQNATGDSVKSAYVDQGYTGETDGITLHVELPEAKRGYVLLPRRWVAK